MKVLGWYTAILNILIIVFFILFMVGVVPEPPFSMLEAIAWAVLSVPVVVLAVAVIKRWE